MFCVLTIMPQTYIGWSTIYIIYIEKADWLFNNRVVTLVAWVLLVSEANCKQLERYFPCCSLHLFQNEEKRRKQGN